MEILYSNDQCGAGKTTWALDRMVAEPGQYVFVVDRNEIATQRKDELDGRAEARGLNVPVIVINAEARETGVQKSVGRRIEDAGAEYGSNPHIILIITHAGMMRCRDWNGFNGWTAIIVDEIPAILEREEHDACRFFRPALQEFYALTPDGDARSRIRFKGGLSADEIPSTLARFHRRVQGGSAFCDLLDWSDLDAPETTRWQSWTQWDVSVLHPFCEVRFLGDGFTDTDTFHLMALDRSLTFRAFTVAQPRTWAPRPVTIRYVSQDRHASSTRFRSEEFALDLAKIGSWLSMVSSEEHLWTSNVGLNIGSTIPGQKVSPKQAGTNAFRTWNHASAIYAAKPSPMERKFFEGWGIASDVIVASREAYDLNQFFMRTSLRLPESREPVELRCFDRHQAETFANKLFASYGLTADLVFDDIGMIERPVSRGGRPPVNGKRAQTQDERREANRLAQRRRRAKVAA